MWVRLRACGLDGEVKRVLVLGGSGFLGRALIGPLAAVGWDVSVVVRSKEAAAKVRSCSPTATIVGTVASDGSAYDAVINLIVDYGRGVSALGPLIRTNVLTPLDILERVRAGTVINVSSALPTNYSHYSASKKMLEGALERLAQQGKFRNVTVLLHNMYGPDSTETNLVSALIGHMGRNERMELASGTNARDFIYIDDTVEALVTLAGTATNGTSPNRVQIGTGRATTIQDLASMIAARMSGRGDIRFGAKSDNPCEPPVLVADMKAMTMLGWRPRCSLEQGLDATIASLAPA